MKEIIIIIISNKFQVILYQLLKVSTRSNLTICKTQSLGLYYITGRKCYLRLDLRLRVPSWVRSLENWTLIENCFPTDQIFHTLSNKIGKRQKFENSCDIFSVQLVALWVLGQGYKLCISIGIRTGFISGFHFSWLHLPGFYSAIVTQYACVSQAFSPLGKEKMWRNLFGKKIWGNNSN